MTDSKKEVNQRLRIALLHYSFPPIVGGVEGTLGHHVRLLETAGHTVRVIAGRGEPWRTGADFRRIPLIDSRNGEILAIKKELDTGEISIEFEKATGRLEVELARALEQTDLLIAHNVCSLNKNLPLTVAVRRWHEKQVTSRLILWHHDLAWITPQYRLELFDRYPWDLLRTAWPGAVQVTISEMRRDELSNLFSIPQDAIRVIPNGIDIPTFLNLGKETEHWVKKLNLLEASPLFLLPARITRRKNMEFAICALAAMRLVFPEASLLITGPQGPHNPSNKVYLTELLELRQRLGLENAVHLLAELADQPVSYAVISDFYRIADALWLPSREEGFGIPLMEAAIAHRPIFCSDLPSLRALGGDEAYYFSPDATPDAVAERIVHILQQDKGFQLATRIRRGYSWEGIYRDRLLPLLMDHISINPTNGGEG
jgi:mannosylglucosylglycerate synthase